MTLRYDLHCHSAYSDGVLTPTALVERAAARGVDVLALTDHDELGGLPEAAAAARDYGITLLAGVEISVSWAGQTLHVVGLDVDTRAAALVGGLNEIRSGRDARAQRIADELAAAGIPGALEGARRYAKNPQLLSRTHFARFLVEAGHARDTSAVFRRYLVEGRPGYVPHRWATLEDAIGWIRAAGGVAVLAHPGRYKLPLWQREELLERFKALGGQAVEVVTGSHAPDEYVYWARTAQRHGLLASTGSDFHAPQEGCDLGGVPALPHGCTPVWQAL